MSGRYTPSVPWKLYCEHCAYYIVVNARGAHGDDPGSGVEAALLMQEHKQRRHAFTSPAIKRGAPESASRGAPLSAQTEGARAGKSESGGSGAARKSGESA